MRKLAFALLLFPFAALAAPCTPKNFSYAYSTSSGSRSLSGSGNVEDLVSANDRYGDGEFLWVRRNNREYVVRDLQFITRVRALFAPLRALEPEIDRVSEEEASLDEQLDAITDGPREKRDDALVEKLRQRLQAIHRRERELDRIQEKIECDSEKKLFLLIDEAIRAGKAKRTS